MNRSRSLFGWILIAFVVGVAMMLGMKATDWVVPTPPIRLEIEIAEPPLELGVDATADRAA